MKSIGSAAVILPLVLASGQLTWGQTTDASARDAIQQSAEYLLKGLPMVEVVRFRYADENVKSFTQGRVTYEQLAAQLEAVLRRFHIPLTAASPPKPAYAFREDGDVGAIFISVNTTTGDTVTATVKLELQELATLKRDPSRKIGATTWVDEQEVASPMIEPQNRFSEAITELGQRFALAYLAANKTATPQVSPAH